MKPFLRIQHPDDPELKAEYAARAAELQALADDQSEAFLSLLGTLGAQACSLNLLLDAQKYLETALEMAKAQHDVQRELANRLRLGVTLQYQDEMEAADAQFQLALKMTLEPELQLYRDTVLQHWGKLLAETGKYAAARTCFEQALFLRQAKQDPDLLEETEDALELLEALGEVDENGYAILMTEITAIEAPVDTHAHEDCGHEH